MAAAGIASQGVEPSSLSREPTSGKGKRDSDWKGAKQERAASSRSVSDSSTRKKLNNAKELSHCSLHEIDGFAKSRPRLGRTVSIENAPGVGKAYGSSSRATGDAGSSINEPAEVFAPDLPGPRKRSQKTRKHLIGNVLQRKKGLNGHRPSHSQLLSNS
jgi:hypothetical protein